jgi:Conserved hypothetical protein 2217 (DUF2460)
MSTFPRLKTGAVAQYPATRTAGYATQAFRFLDGTEQKFPQRGAAAARWVIKLDLLDDTEMAEVCGFFLAQQGRFGTFSFTDPWDGSVHATCSFESDELALSLEGEARGRLQVTIKENNG